MKLKIDFENCYGIKKLKHEFEFSENSKTFSIYASNGTMKTSFAKTFDDISKGKSPKDLIFTDRDSVCKIDANSQPINKESIFVIRSYDKDYQSDKRSLLLANKKLRKEYEDIYKNIEQSKEDFLKALKKICKITRIDEIEKNISKTFHHKDENKFFEALNRIRDEVNADDIKQYKNVHYKNIFQDAIKELLTKDDIRKNIQMYIEKYDALLEGSTYFKKGIFNHSQAEEIANQLKSNGFFKANHAVLFGGEKIEDERKLIDIIETEKNKILTDETLQDTFKKLDDLLRKNEGARSLREFLLENQFIIAELDNLDGFEANLWKYYMSENKESFNKLLEEYDSNKAKIKIIFKKANDEKNDWTAAIQIFNERFIVPFEVIVNNRIAVVLEEHSPVIGFDFVEQSERKTILKDNLLAVLSQGEKRALYLLDIIFEIEARKKEGGLHLFIIDDIADSFDYKNKYAIIEYLKDISETEDFFQIVLSHNYDFHRTIASRLSIQKRHNKLEVKKNKGGIALNEEKYQHSVFNDWRIKLDDKYKFIASIGMVRNLAEYSGNDSVFNNLTLCMHMKEGADDIKIKFIKEQFNEILPNEVVDKISNDETCFLDFLEESINSMPSDVELEHKIVLAISIRLEAEKFMIKKINDEEYVKNIKKNQTQKLLNKFKILFPDDAVSIKILNKVQLMTPESIHINSFMFEPLLDMDHEYLTKLNTEIRELN